MIAIATTGACGDDPEGTTTGTPGSTGSATGGSGGVGGGTGGVADGGGGQGGSGGQTAGPTYSNPLSASIAGGGLVENCPDPAIIRGQQPGDENWYVFCTADPHNGADKDASGEYIEHWISILKSADLVTWSYVGDALQGFPSWADPASTDIWAPDIQFFNGKYYLYYSIAVETANGLESSAIGVATSDSPTGPWTQSDKPAIEAHAPACCAGANRWTIDPFVITDETGQRYIYYGSYFGGMSIRKLSDDGLTSDPASQVEIVLPERYEAAYVVPRDGYYYLFASATNCCNGPLTGYSVFAGRSKSPLGPFVDREGIPFLASNVGGTPVLSMNGNRWVGPGHGAITTDLAGQDWFFYHAVDQDDAYLNAADTKLHLKRQLLMDPLDWVDGWPTVRGGLWASDGPQPAPVSKAGEESHYTVEKPAEDAPGAAIEMLSDEFEVATLSGQWTWVREPDPATFGLSGGAFRMQTQSGDLWTDLNSASVLHEAAPAGDYIVETKLTLDMPPAGCCFNYTQAGLTIYKDDDNYLKLVSFSLADTRQIEFGKEVSDVQPGFPRYGNTVLGPPAKTIWLRIVKRGAADEELYTAYASHDGMKWVRGGTWTHKLGPDARIGLVAQSRTADVTIPYPAIFDYVRVYDLQP
ncbi:family 43 glycosylhydrolase [Polyangium aurulentum]|uniref:family 43 glycosylhydrolase n=1 Tax=Polyangium aurulentum TaxID=2567896 RepID=UPI001F1F3D65|nr:family 43 glycosylhydrolase [Polyangium aurulentum]